MFPYRRPWRTFWEASLVEDIKHLRWTGRMVSLFGHHLRKQRQCLVISGDHKRTLYLALLTWTEPRNWLSRVVALGTAELRLSQEPTDKEESATYLSGVLRLRGTTGSIDLAFAHRRSCLLFYFQLRFNCPAIVTPFKRSHLSCSLPVCTNWPHSSLPVNWNSETSFHPVFCVHVAPTWYSLTSPARYAFSEQRESWTQRSHSNPADTPRSQDDVSLLNVAH